MNSPAIQWMVVTDLDGTLLNHHTYDTGSVPDTIEKLEQHKIPVVLNTSKTFAETLDIREQLKLHSPFVVENGSCLYLAKSEFTRPSAATERGDYWEVVLGSRKQDIDTVLQTFRTLDKQCIRLSQCTIQQAVELTGLTEAQAENAIVREFSEPLIWQGSAAALDDFKEGITQNGLSTIQGGRFLHVTGQCDKGTAIKQLTQLYQQDIKTIVLGDSENDASMLAMADIAVVVSSPSNQQLDTLITADLVTQQPAPEGWCEAIDKSLVQLNLIRS